MNPQLNQAASQENIPVSPAGGAADGAGDALQVQGARGLSTAQPLWHNKVQGQQFMEKQL